MRHALTLSLLVAVVTTAALSCGPTRRGSTCYDASDCPADEGELFACTNGVCEGVDCLSTTDCPIGQICDVEDFDYECEDGCNSNFDCPAGSVCTEDGQCEEYGCRSTVLDCAWGEICDEDSGECVEADGAFCGGCSMAANAVDDQGTETTCDDVILANGGCGGAGQICMNYFDLPTCYISCESQDDCPAGYQCLLLERGLPAGCDDDTIELGTFCFNDCEPGD